MARLAGSVEEILAWFAGRKRGLVTREELLGAGISDHEIRHRLKIGLLIKEFDGSYWVGHRPPSVEAHYLAAVLAAGSGARLSGLAGAFLLGLVKGRPPAPEITAPTKRRLKGVITHRSGRGEARRYRGIRVSTPPWLLVEIAGRLSDDELARACHEAGVRFRTTPRQVEAVLSPTTPGAGKLRRIMEGDTRVVLSKLEEGFVRLLRDEKLDLPITNRPAGSHHVDCRWPERRLTVELDSYRFHNSRHSWKNDRRREREAYARGDRFRRFIWEDVFERPGPMLAELRGLLSE